MMWVDPGYFALQPKMGVRKRDRSRVCSDAVVQMSPGPEAGFSTSVAWVARLRTQPARACLSDVA
jgi:hypothetical protein